MPREEAAKEKKAKKSAPADRPIEPPATGDKPGKADTPAKKNAAGPANQSTQPAPSAHASLEKNAQPQEAQAPAGPGAPPAAFQLRAEGKAEILSSKVGYEGPLFKVMKEEVREPNGHVTHRDVIRHNGSVVILAIDASGKKGKKDPVVIMERQYRHAAGQYLWELPAGKIEPNEERLAGAKRELEEETGYAAATWTELVRYFASPGFLGEWMQIYLAEDLTAGTARPEADETLEIYPLPLSEVEELIASGQVLDGKTLIGIGMYRQLQARRKAAKDDEKKGSGKHSGKKKKKGDSKKA